jgi:nitroreductase
VSALDALLARRSVAAQYLTEPGPSPAQIDLAIDAALRAPDHGRIQPWRFRLVRGAARNALAERLAAATRARDPAVPDSQLEKLRARARTPLIIAVSAALKADPKVPEVEQLLSVGAGVMNLLNAFALQGFGAIWLTGPNAYDDAVALALGLGTAERLLGFVYVGSPAANTPGPIARPARGQRVSDWIG